MKITSARFMPTEIIRFTLLRLQLVLDPKFDLDFNTAFSTGPARPHGIAIR
jgi:hypothetical protein